MTWTPYLILHAIGLTIGLTALGASAAEGLGIVEALVFWAAHVAPALVLLALCQCLVSRSKRVSALPASLQIILAATIAALLFAPIALAIDARLAAEAARDQADDALWRRLTSELTHFFIPLLLIWLLINMPSLMQAARTTSPPAAPQPRSGTDKDTTGSNALAEFWGRVPARLGQTLVALSAELHYLRVHTTEGETLILFPFGRAVDLLQAEHGMQIHRSHWVALDQIDEVISRDSRMSCRMIGGLTLPVSRRYRAALKAAWRGQS
ncbi:MAG: LytTR family DNA-binding domain-containing protein [Pseudomonadota bacterium]